MIKKILPKFITVMLSSVLFVILGLLVVYAEHNKKLEKTRDHYKTLKGDWISFEEQYLAEIERIKKENTASMAKARNDYERLLRDQNALIAQHTKTVADGNQSTQQGGTTIASGTPKTTTQTIKISKPKSSTSTKAS